LAWEEIGSGGIIDSFAISNLLNQIPGSKRVLLQLTESPAGWIVDEVRNSLVAAGVPGVEVYTGSPELNISWINQPEISSRAIAIGPLAIIGIIMVAIAAIIVFVIGWKLYQDLGSLGPVLLPFAAIAVIGLIAAVAYSKFRS
jgi:hypothetical protein